MHLQKEDYESMADGIVDSFAARQEPLNSSILKIAKEHDMNPDQIKRLVEMSNVKAFLKLFKDPANREKNIEFDVADPKKVLDDYYKPGAKGGKTISITKITVTGGGGGDGGDFFSDIPNMMHAKKYPEDAKSVREKTAEAVDDLYVAKPKREVVEFRLRKVAQQFHDKIYELEHEYQEGLDKLASEFRRDYGPDYREFEKTALHLHGLGVMPLIEDLRKVTRCKTEVYDLEKAASRVFIDDNTPEHTLFAKMVECKQDQLKYASAHKIAKERLRSVRAV
jgi:hypothetical protein